MLLSPDAICCIWISFYLSILSKLHLKDFPREQYTVFAKTFNSFLVASELLVELDVLEDVLFQFFLSCIRNVLPRSGLYV